MTRYRNIRIVVVLASLLAVSAIVDEREWTKLSTSGDIPSGRTTPAVATLGRSTYLFGGLRDDFATFESTFFDDLHRFDTKTNTWTELFRAGDRPAARTFATPAPHRGHHLLLVFGGSVFDPTFTEFEVFGDLWTYSPDDNEWIEIIADNEGPVPRSGATIWVDDDRALVFRGITQFFELNNGLWADDFSRNTWTHLIPDGAPGSPPGRHVASHLSFAIRSSLSFLSLSYA